MRWAKSSGWYASTSRIISAMAVVIGGALVIPLPADAVVGTEQIQGSGSSWAYNAVQTWVNDVENQYPIVYTPSGSAQGRQDFANGVTDFGVSDTGYLGNTDGVSGDQSNRAYVYVPIVAGGTAFPYNIVVGGQRIENLRLSGLTLAKIFTNQITNWDDPEITADNNGRALPSIPIIPVVHSEGAGTTFQFTNWLFNQYPSLWQQFTRTASGNGSSYNYPVEYWPTGVGNQVAENGSDGVINFVTSSAGQGSIGFDEYSYALFANFPVVALENSGGYFTMPDAYNVAVSLTKAAIDFNQSSPNYLLAQLNNVWTYNDPRDYPLSSYSYLIEPTGGNNDPTMNSPKRQTLVNFVDYSVCQGQAQMAPIGYSPLPINLVERSQQQVKILGSVDSAVNVSQVSAANCGNPTFLPSNPNENYLAQIAPLPPACAKAGAGPCSGQYAYNGNPVGGKAGGFGITSRPAGTSTGGKSSPVGKTTSGGNASSGGTATGTGSSAGIPTASANAATGASASPGTTNGSNGTPSSAGSSVALSTANVEGNPTNLAAAHPPIGSTETIIEALVAALIIVAMSIPLLINRVASRRKRTP